MTNNKEEYINILLQLKMLHNNKINKSYIKYL